MIIYKSEYLFRTSTFTLQNKPIKQNTMKTETGLKIVELVINAIKEIIDAVKEEDKQSEDSKK